MTALQRVLDSRLRAGTLDIVLPNGRQMSVSGREAGPEAAVTLNRWRAVRRFATGGAVGFGEAYVDGDWDTPDLPAMIELAARNMPVSGGPHRWLSPWRLADRMRHLRRPNTVRGSARNIAAHYDLGNEFYALWLDSTLTYSSAVFTAGANSLEAAQGEKYRRLLDLIDANPGDRILEIGCGWGAFAMQAARERGVRVTSLTISRAQYEEAKRRVAEAGLSELVDIQLRDYRTISDSYDHAVSIEMIEAVGERNWPAYFDRVAASLRPGGRFALQSIVIENTRFDAYRWSADFVQKHVFPGGLLPSPDILRKRAEASGLAWERAAGYGLDYARTLEIWRERFEAAAAQVSALGFDDRFRRCWSYYLAYCEGAFRAGNIDALQVAMVKR